MARRSRLPEGLSLAEVAVLVGGELHGPESPRVQFVAELGSRCSGAVVFAADAVRIAELKGCDAAVALVDRTVAAAAAQEYGLPTIGVDSPHAAIALVLERMYPLVAEGTGVHAAAFVAETASLGSGVVVHPGAVVAAEARIGDATEIGPGAYVGHAVRVGSGCVLHSNVVLYEGTTIGDRALIHAGAVIGADGFGFARAADEQLKIPQVGGVQIGDDVEIGANSCVDRGTLSATVIGSGTKIDNLVQIGHNCRIGRNCALSALTGLAGSTVLEDGVITGGHVGTAGHQVIGERSMLAAMSGVHGDIAPGSLVGGAPHMELRVWRRMVAALPRLPDLLRRVRRIERRLEEPSEE